MGNFDRWTTPKQIKIARAGEPRGTRRGRLKKGERHKGVKARIDEILSAQTQAKRYAKWVLEERQRRIDHPEWYEHPGAYSPEYNKWFDQCDKKLRDLVQKAVKDGVVTAEEGTKFFVEKP